MHVIQMEIKPYVLDDQVCDKCAGNNNVQDKDTTLFCPEPECLLVIYFKFSC